MTTGDTESLVQPQPLPAAPYGQGGDPNAKFGG